MIIERPKISVVMSVFNMSNYLSYSIESILRQSFKDFEFIIINDGSSDDSHEIMKDYALSDSRIKILSHSNIGLTASLIKGVIISKGKFIARIDADDISLPHRLEIQLKEIIRRKLDVLGSNFITIDKNGQILKSYDLRKNENKILKTILGGNSPFPHSSVMIKKESLEAISSYNSFYKKSQDLDLWLRFYENGYKIGFSETQKPMIKLRIHSKSLTFNNHEDIFTCVSILEYYSRQNELDQLSNLIKNRDLIKTTLIVKKSFYYKSISFKLKFKNNLKAIMFKQRFELNDLLGLFNFLFNRYFFLIIISNFHLYKLLHKELKKIN